MIGGTGFENKTKEPTHSHIVIVLEVCVVVGLSMQRIDMYIDHDRSVGPFPGRWRGRSRFSSGLCRYA